MSRPSDRVIVQVIESNSVRVIPTVAAHSYWAEACRRYVALSGRRAHASTGPPRPRTRPSLSHPSQGGGPTAS